MDQQTDAGFGQQTQGMERIHQIFALTVKGLMTMRWRKPSFRHLREKRLTAMNIPRKQISKKTWNICQPLQPCPSPSNLGVQGSCEI